MVHVNCPGQPEVTYFFLGHAYIAQGGGMAASADEQLLDKVTHRLKVCAICAYEKALSVRVLRDFMSCNDTCTRRKVAADSSNDVGAGRTETFTFTEQSNVYCHEFLTSADTPIPPLGQDCRGTCQSSLEVRFMVTDTSVAGEAAFGVASTGLGQVYLDQVLTCHEGYRSTCKSTFGH
ncbi:hypothetical protein C0Q70_19178 [Pomacea canaliculata]|uniref:Uncharacterized protein n=2 Tax=Pomacea canaliculata TaxID=400727 RepID=A0A2T7NIM9_POMCA|nr:hypothetical protein C0Q70_19178 [Pomacea canaliculata]